MVRDPLIRLNPEIKAQPDRADEVLYRLRTIPLSVQSEGLVRANDLFAELLRGDFDNDLHQYEKKGEL